MQKIKHKTLRGIEIRVIDALRKIDSDGYVQDLTEDEFVRLLKFDEFVMIDDEPIIKVKPVKNESEVEVMAETEVDTITEIVTEDKPKRGRPAGNLHK